MDVERSSERLLGLDGFLVLAGQSYGEGLLCLERPPAFLDEAQAAAQSQAGAAFFDAPQSASDHLGYGV